MATTEEDNPTANKKRKGYIPNKIPQFPILDINIQSTMATKAEENPSANKKRKTKDLPESLAYLI
jgi:hypothetical protein